MKNNLLLNSAEPVTLRIPDFKRVYLTLVGCGGTGSHIASGLVAIALALVERNVPMDMLFIDPDRVEPKNVGRQLFSLADVGKSKAEVLADRLNRSFGLRIGADVRSIDKNDFILTDTEQALNIVVGVVDNPAARLLLAAAVVEARGRLWWLDCGNENHSGQVALGNIADATKMIGAIGLGLIDRLPAPHLLYPDLIKTSKVQRSRRGPSCAEATAAGDQALMINRTIAAWACSMLSDFLTTRDLKYFALAVDLQWGGARAYTIDTPTIAEACGLEVKQMSAKGKK